MRFFGGTRRDVAAVIDRTAGNRRGSRFLEDVGKALLVGMAYYVAAILSLRMALVGGQVTPIWPPTGIAVFGLLTFGRKIWPGIAIGAFLVNAPIGPILFTALGITAGNTLAPLLAVVLLQKVDFRVELARLRDALAIVLLGAFSMTVSATGGSTSLLLSGSVSASEFWSTWFVWWTGDAMGVFLVAPFLLSLRHVRRRAGTGWRGPVEAGLLFGGLAIVGYLVFKSQLHIQYLVFPFLGWAALRYQQRGAAPAALLASAIAIWAAVNRTGPFADGTLLDRMVTLQIFNATAAFASFVLAAVVAERTRDVEKRRIAEEERAKSERKFRTLFEVAVDPILLVDSRATISDANPAASMLTGRQRENLIGVNVSDILPREELPRVREYLRVLLDEDLADEPFEGCIDAPSGRRFVQVRSRVIREPGERPYIQLVARDVTEEMELQARLVENERLASMGRVAGYVAHEINTPLTNISLLAATAAKRAQNPEVVSRLEKIGTQRRLIASILQDLLGLTRPPPIEPVETDVREIVDGALDQMAPYLREAVEVRKETTDHAVIAQLDTRRIQQVLVNLLKNALQATSRGSVTVRLEDRGETIAVAVADTGTGMAPDVVEKLFQPFFTTKGEAAGTGLGLAFARSVVAAHGGTIQVDSIVGKGSTFTVIVPRNQSLRDAPALEKAP